MTHIFKLLETLDTETIRLRCPECGRQVRLSYTGKVVEVVGNIWEGHRYAAEDDMFKFSFEADTEER